MAYVSLRRDGAILYKKKEIGSWWRCISFDSPNEYQAEMGDGEVSPFFKKKEQMRDWVYQQRQVKG